ncbi:MAG: valine--pyruvate transaminase [Ectothiorhodospiraceae bacterium AqS1]|nr:valine--pyruvate transaminase [Ectothiorhodospiraceae bacterium AqS1]
MKISALGRRLTGETGTRSLMDDLGAAAVEGREVFQLGGGNPAFVPEAEELFRSRMQILMQQERIFEQGIGRYAIPEGDRDFAQALADLLRKEQGWDLSERNIVLTNGSQSAFLALFNLLAGPGEDGIHRRILLPLAPEYIGYSDLGLNPDILASERSTITEIGEGLFKYGIDFDAVSAVEDIGAICVSRPTNPTGNVVTDEEMRRLGDLARTCDVPLIVDNAYGLPFPGIVHSDARLEWDENTVLCMSLSKIGLPGFRTGIVVAREEIIEALGAINAIFCLAPGNFGPLLAEDLVRNGDILALSRNTIRPFYLGKAERALDRLRAGLGDCGALVHKPEGAFFLWLWMPGLPITNHALYERLKARGVFVVSGHYFFPGLEGDDWTHKNECIRISYAAADDDKVARGIDIIIEEVRRAYDHG